VNNIAIKVENLSKRYRIGLKEELHDTFIGNIIAIIKSPLSNYSRLKRLSKFNDIESQEDILWALKDVSFEVKHGQVLGVIGPNGAGKSTLLKIMARITEPTSGEVLINGRIASLLEVGTGFHAELTGRENVYLNGTLLGMKKREVDQKFDEIVEFSGVKDFIDTPVKRYSSGMKVRLAFAIAAHLDPEILLIDEVLAVGDVDFQNKCIAKMDKLSHSGKTVLLVSHNMNSIQRLCENAFLLDKGMIIKTDTTDEVIKNYYELMDKNSSMYIVNKDSKNKDYYINDIQLVDYNGKSSNVFNRDESFGVVIKYTINKPANYFSVVFTLVSGLNSGIIQSYNINDEETFNGILQPGVYISKVTFPGKLLNYGKYKFYIMLREGNLLIDDSEEIFFTLLDSKSLPQNPGKNSHIPCLSFPLEWETKNNDNSSK